jgi:Xaa-Pro aminopeptidase
MQNRLSKIKKIMVSKGIDYILISKPENQFYLTGFHSTNCHLIISSDTNYLLTDFRYIEAAGEVSSVYHVVLLDNNVSLYSFISDLNISKLAIEEGVISNLEAKKIKKETGCTFISGDGIVETARVIKEPDEIKAIKRAQAIAEKGFHYMLDNLRPGMTEKEAALKLELFLREAGADRLAFETILVSGMRTSLPHGSPTDKIMEKGDFVTIDFGCVVDGYCSDMTRTVALGHVSDKQRDIYSIVLEAQVSGCSSLKAGLSCHDADRACRSTIEDAGYGAFFGHGTGHGIGLEIHEAPTLNSRSKEVLKEDMVVTIEPGIYLPKEFGVRIEDLAIITPSGIINMTKVDKELIII